MTLLLVLNVHTCSCSTDCHKVTKVSLFTQSLQNVVTAQIQKSFFPLKTDEAKICKNITNNEISLLLSFDFINILKAQWYYI